MKKSHAFTLVEILAAGSLLSVIVLLLFVFSDGAFSLVASTRLNLQQRDQLRVLAAVLRSDMQSATLRTEEGRRLGLYGFTTTDTAVLALAYPRGNGETAEVVHVVYRWDRSTGNLVRVELSEPVGSSASALELAALTYSSGGPGMWWDSDRVTEALRSGSPLISGVLRMSWEFFEETGRGPSWMNDRALPRAVSGRLLLVAGRKGWSGEPTPHASSREVEILAALPGAALGEGAFRP